MGAFNNRINLTPDLTTNFFPDAEGKIKMHREEFSR